MKEAIIKNLSFTTIKRKLTKFYFAIGFWILDIVLRKGTSFSRNIIKKSPPEGMMTLGMP